MSLRVIATRASWAVTAEKTLLGAILTGRCADAQLALNLVFDLHEIRVGGTNSIQFEASETDVDEILLDGWTRGDALKLDSGWSSELMIPVHSWRLTTVQACDVARRLLELPEIWTAEVVEAVSEVLGIAEAA